MKDDFLFFLLNRNYRENCLVFFRIGCKIFHIKIWVGKVEDILSKALKGDCLTFSNSVTACRCTHRVLGVGVVSSGRGRVLKFKRVRAKKRGGGALPRPSGTRPVDVWEFTPLVSMGRMCTCQPSDWLGRPRKFDIWWEKKHPIWLKGSSNVTKRTIISNFLLLFLFLFPFLWIY